MSSPHEAATLLFGRDKDLELLHAFVGQSSSGGGALVLSGAPGVGKTVLLEAVAAHWADAGLRVLRAAGAEFEADLSYAGLNQVLHPLFDDIEDLSPPQHTALDVALGLGDGPAPDQLVVCNAGLSLLVKAASKEPLLVIVDDLQWVDRASALVLGFAARRLHGTRVGFLAAFRSGDESFFERSGLRARDLGPPVTVRRPHRGEPERPVLPHAGRGRQPGGPRGPGSIVSIGSTSAHAGQPYLAPYVAAKAGLAGLTRNAAHTHRWDRIRINGLNIGWTDTEGEDATQRRFHGAGDDWRAKAGASLPMGKLGQVGEIADFVVFLLSDRSGVVTGSVIDWNQNALGGMD